MIETLSAQLAKSAVENKVMLRVKQSNPPVFQPFKMIVEPYQVRQKQMKSLIQSSSLWQKITHRASQDYKFMQQTLQQMQSDKVIRELWKIYSQCHKKCPNYIKKPRIVLFRTDYFITETQKKLIEYNTLSVSMAFISSAFQLSRSKIQSQRKFPENKCFEVYTESIRKFYYQNKCDGIIIMAVQSQEMNIIDQEKFIEQLQIIGNLKAIRVEIKDLHNLLSLDEKGDLYFGGKEKVSIVYYRGGYKPQQYDQNLLKIKKMVEFSSCVAVPSVGAELVGQKRVQAELSKKEIARRFLTEQEVEILMETVIESWDFAQKDDQKYGNTISFMEKEGIQNFVLKPNAEGGNNNYFGEKAYEKLKTLSPEERSNFILTRRIVPRRMLAHLITADSQGSIKNVQKQEIDSEISIYGVIYNIENQIDLNDSDGFLVRCKPKQINQGGLMAGSGAICSLEIMEENDDVCL